MDRNIYGRGPTLGEAVARRVPKGFGGDHGANIPGLGVPQDSAPLPIAFGFFANDRGPTVPIVTERLKSYVVPAKRRATIQNLTLCVVRHNQPVGSGFYGMNWVVTRADAGASIYSGATTSAGFSEALRIVMFTEFNGNIDSQQNAVYPGQIELFENDRIDLRIFDTSNGGSVDYYAGLTGVEFDLVEKAHPQNVDSGIPNVLKIEQPAVAATTQAPLGPHGFGRVLTY